MQYYFYYVIIPNMVFIPKLTHNRRDASAGTSQDAGMRIRLHIGFCRDTT